MTIDASLFRGLFPDLCGDLTDADLGPLLACLRPRPFAAGEQLCRQGAHSARALFLVQGEVELRASAPGVTATLGTLEPGRWANALPLIEPGPAEFDVYGKTAGSGLEMTFGDFLELRRQHPTTARVFLSGLIHDLSNRLRMSQLVVGPAARPERQTARAATGWLGGASMPANPTETP